MIDIVAEARSGYGSAPRSHRDLRIYRKAFDLATQLSRIAKAFPKDEQYSLTSQMRRSARSVYANIAEAWRKRRYEGAFIAKLSDADAEAAETQAWLETGYAEGYLDGSTYAELLDQYEMLLGSIVGVIDHADKWVIKK